jgi:hypothetical protein
MHAALEAAQHIGNAESPSDIFREYQGWLTREMELLAEDGKSLSATGAESRSARKQQAGCA